MNRKVRAEKNGVTPPHNCKRGKAQLGRAKITCARCEAGRAPLGFRLTLVRLFRRTAIRQMRRPVYIPPSLDAEYRALRK
jgi:hypothetical protein